MKEINRNIFRLAGPSILANITVPFVGMVDIAVAGHISASLPTATLIGGIRSGRCFSTSSIGISAFSG